MSHRMRVLGASGIGGMLNCTSGNVLHPDEAVRNWTKGHSRFPSATLRPQIERPSAPRDRRLRIPVEVESAKMMVDRVEERFELTPERLIGDTAYGTASMLAWMVEDKGIEPMCRCGKGGDATTRRCPAATFSGTSTLPARTPPTQRVACVQEPAHAHNQGRHDHLSAQSVRLRNVPDERALLPKHTDSQDRAQHP